jgi:hypothetical protein
MTATWTLDRARGSVAAARVDLARRVASEQAVTLALRRVRAAFMADNGWSQAEIAQTLGCGLRTTERDLHHMRQLDESGAADTDRCLPPIRARGRVHPPIGRP